MYYLRISLGFMLFAFILGNLTSKNAVHQDTFARNGVPVSIVESMEGEQKLKELHLGKCIAFMHSAEREGAYFNRKNCRLSLEVMLEERFTSCEKFTIDNLLSVVLNPNSSKDREVHCF